MWNPRWEIGDPKTDHKMPDGDLRILPDSSSRMGASNDPKLISQLGFPVSCIGCAAEKTEIGRESETDVLAIELIKVHLPELLAGITFHMQVTMNGIGSAGWMRLAVKTCNWHVQSLNGNTPWPG